LRDRSEYDRRSSFQIIESEPKYPDAAVAQPSIASGVTSLLSLMRRSVDLDAEVRGGTIEV
jgi:hypothetical protein